MTPDALPPRRDACTEWRRRLAEAEARLAAPRAAEEPAVDVVVGALRAHPATCSGCAKSHGSRLSAVEAALALRARSLPEGILDGFYERIEADARMVPLGGGMSLAFLDAPRALRIWRRAALAAGLLLAAGVAWVGTHGVGTSAPTSRPIRLDPEYSRFVRSAASGSDTTAGLIVRPAGGWTAAPRGQDGFFRPRPTATPASLVTHPRVEPAPATEADRPDVSVDASRRDLRRD